MPRLWRSRTFLWLVPLLVLGLLLPLWVVPTGSYAAAQGEPTPDPTGTAGPTPSPTPSTSPTEEPSPTPTEDPCVADPAAEGCGPDCEADPAAEGCGPDCEADPAAEGCTPTEEPTEEPDKPETAPANPQSLNLDQINSGSEVDLPPAGRSPDTGYVVINGILRSPAAVSGLLTQLGEVAGREGDALARLRGAIEGQGGQTTRTSSNLADLEANLEKLEERLDEVESQLDALEAMGTQLDEYIAGRQDDMVEQAVAAYIGVNSRDSRAGLELTVEDPVLGSIMGEYLEATAVEIAPMGPEDESGLIATRQMLTLALDTHSANVKSATKVTVAARAELKELRAQLEDQLASYDETVLALLQEVSAIRTEKNSLAAALGSKDPDPTDVLAIVAEALADNEEGDQTLGLPLDGPPAIVSGFGLRFHPIFQETRLHSGADLSAPYGTPILAAAPGRVVLAQSQIGYGLVVIVEHAGGISTLYSHMSGFAVGLGQKVNKGEVIGFVGSTGYSTGPHLHYEVRVQGNPVDPIPYLRAAQGG